MAFPVGVLVPNWSWTLSQVVVAIAGHLPSHDAGTRFRFPQHHLAHHKLFTVNFGLLPSEDKRFGTLYAGE
jgi:sterol desaturase/sphingolipid hydroxylase (fatty acid hydroxylase superfamily)